MHPKVLEIAETELRETESRKVQTLEQFKDWLEKHPFLVSTRRDDIFLLSFLRLCKYNVDKACQRYEKTFTIMKKYPEMFLFDVDNMEKCFNIIRSGYIYALPGFDDEGCKVIINRICERDLETQTPVMILTASRYLFLSLLNEHENQMCKYKMILDFSNVTMKHIFNPMESKVAVESNASALSVRVSKYILINTSPVVTGGVEFVKMLLSEKMRKRVVVLKNQDELVQHINPISMLPKRYGGTKDEEELRAESAKNIIDNREIILKTIKCDIDMEKIPKSKLEKDEFEHVGSFLKLEID